MKEITLVVVILIISFFNGFSQSETYEPDYRSRDNKNVELDNVEINKDYTIITMTYTGPFNGKSYTGEYWHSYISFDKGYIEADKKKYKLVKSEIKHSRKVEAGEDLEFNLYFKPVKAGIESIDICEKRGSFNFFGVEIDNPKSKKRTQIVPDSNPTLPETKNVLTYVVDVDHNIPETKTVNDKTFALIIGNETYTNEIQVKYALNDVRIFKQYLLKTLGLPETNVQYYENATFGQIQEALAWINSVTKVFNGQAKIILYYAGHGIPDEQTKSAFLLPTDGNSQNQATAIKLSYIYSTITEFPSSSVIVFLDACFSGAARDDNGAILAESRGVKIKPKTDTLTGNLLVFSAATDDEAAFPYIEKQHGLFTYFLLKKLQETKGKVKLSELSDYLITNVTQSSIVINKRIQTPQVNVSSAINSDWENWELNKNK